MIGYKFVTSGKDVRCYIIVLEILGRVDIDPDYFREPTKFLNTQPYKTDKCKVLLIYEYSTRIPTDRITTNFWNFEYKKGDVITIPDYTPDNNNGIYFFKNATEIDTHIRNCKKAFMHNPKRKEIDAFYRKMLMGKFKKKGDK